MDWEFLGLSALLSIIVLGILWLLGLAFTAATNIEKLYEEEKVFSYWDHLAVIGSGLFLVILAFLNSCLCHEITKWLKRVF